MNRLKIRFDGVTVAYFWIRLDAQMHTSRKTNMSPENQWLADVFPIEKSPFLGDMLVFAGVDREGPRDIDGESS